MKNNLRIVNRLEAIGWSSNWVILGLTTSGRAAKTSVDQGTKIYVKVRITVTVAFWSGALHLNSLAWSKCYSRFGGSAAGHHTLVCNLLKINSHRV